MKMLYLSLLLLPLAAPMTARADQLIPAGSIIQCTVGDGGKISSKTEKVGDPILCQLGHTEAYGRSVFPYGSYIEGHFQDYKDPGHFVGKGWMELRFDRLIVQPDTIVPIDARVVQVPKYNVDDEGRILGKGHAVKDTIEWLIPVLWPIDLINLPRRGPRPVLQPETRLTLKVLSDFGIPTPQENAVRTPAITSRTTADEPTYQNYQAPILQQRQPQQDAYAAPQQNYPQQQYAAPIQQSYAPQPAPVYSQPAPVVVNFVQQPAQPIFVQQQAPPQVIVQQQRPRVVYAPPRPVYVPYGYYRMGPYGPY